MKKLLTLLLCGVLVLSLGACTAKPDTDTHSPTDPTEEDYEKVYVDNPTVNQFINNLYEQSNIQLLGTSRGTKENQYILYTNNCEVTAFPTEQGLYLDICGGKSEKDLERAISLFRHFTLIADSSATEERITEAEGKMKKPDSSFGDYRVSNYVKILRFRSLVTQANISVDCHIEMLLMNYLPAKENE